MVSVQVFGQVLQTVVEESEMEVPVMAPTTVKQLVEQHPAQFEGLLPYLASREILITINKKIGSEDSPICDGDLVKLSFQSRVSYDGNRDIPT